MPADGVREPKNPIEIRACYHGGASKRSASRLIRAYRRLQPKRAFHAVAAESKRAWPQIPQQLYINLIREIKIGACEGGRLIAKPQKVLGNRRGYRLLCHANVYHRR